MENNDAFSAKDAYFIQRERAKQERIQASAEAADRNFKEGLRAAFRDATTRDALASEIIRAGREAGSSNSRPTIVRSGEGFEGV